MRLVITCLLALTLSACASSDYAIKNVTAKPPIIKDPVEFTCWDDSLAWSEETCPPMPGKIRCWDKSIKDSDDDCTDQPPEPLPCWVDGLLDDDVTLKTECSAENIAEYCWDGVTVIDPEYPEKVCPPAPEP